MIVLRTKVKNNGPRRFVYFVYVADNGAAMTTDDIAKAFQFKDGKKAEGMCRKYNYTMFDKLVV